MTILHICSTYLDRPFYKSLFDSLSKMGINNIIYVPRWSGKEVDDNVYVISKKFSKIEKLLYWGEQRYILKDIEERINLNDIDLIHVHRLLYGGYAALHIKKKLGIPYIVATRNSDIYGFGRNISIYKHHCNNIMKNASHNVFLSETYKNFVLSNYIYGKNKESIKGKSDVITNGISSFFLENRMGKNRHPIPTNNAINIICIAEVNKNKNVLTLIESCKILLDKGYKIKLRLLGKVLNASIFRKIISNNFVEYLGIKPKEELINILRSSDIFAMPSIHESFGLVYAEAMTQGLPVIYTRGQGFDGQFKEGEVGFSVDCFNSTEISNRILDILRDYNNISNRCIERSQRYSWSTIANKYKILYDTCLLNT